MAEKCDDTYEDEDPEGVGTFERRRRNDSPKAAVTAEKSFAPTAAA